MYKNSQSPKIVIQLPYEQPHFHDPRLHWRERRVDRAELDVRVNDLRRSAALDIRRLAAAGRARPTRDAGAAGRLGRGVVRVEPQHVRVVVVPHRQHEHHAVGQGLAHAGEPSHGVELVGVAKGLLLRVAEGLGDAVAGHAGDGALAVGDGLAVLDVEALDLLEAAGVGAIGRDELRDDCDFTLRVHGHAWPVEILDAHAIPVFC